MSSGNLTITGITGPGESVTSKVISDVKSIEFNIAKNVIKVTYGDNYDIIYFEYANIATVTYTIASGVATIAVSS